VIGSKLKALGIEEEKGYEEQLHELKKKIFE
jgi:hypothetical protein